MHMRDSGADELTLAKDYSYIHTYHYVPWLHYLVKADEALWADTLKAILRSTRTALALLPRFESIVPRTSESSAQVRC